MGTPIIRLQTMDATKEFMKKLLIYSIIMSVMLGLQRLHDMEHTQVVQAHELCCVGVGEVEEDVLRSLGSTTRARASERVRLSSVQTETTGRAQMAPVLRPCRVDPPCEARARRCGRKGRVPRALETEANTGLVLMATTACVYHAGLH